MWHWGLKDPMLSTRNGTSGMKVCPECHGRGRIEDEDGNIVTCPECHGSGAVAGHRNASALPPLFQLIGNLVDSGLHALLIDAIVESVCAIAGFFRILGETP